MYRSTCSRGSRAEPGGPGGVLGSVPGVALPLEEQHEAIHVGTVTLLFADPGLEYRLPHDPPVEGWAMFHTIRAAEMGIWTPLEDRR